MFKHLYSHFTRYLILLAALLVIGCDENVPTEQASAGDPPANAQTSAADKPATDDKSAPAAVSADADADVYTDPDDYTAPDGYTDIVLGNPDAPIKVIEYASMTCSHCATFHEEVFYKFKKEYLDTGRASYVLRHFVLNGPDLAASMIARCMDENRYYPVVGLFLGKQASWIPPWQNVTPGEEKSLADMAIEAKMDDFLRPTGIGSARIRACLDTGKLRDDLLRQRAEGDKQYSITGTPTIIINGEKYEGALEYGPFEAAIRRYE